MKEIILEDIINSAFQVDNIPREGVKRLMKEACRQVLELAAETKVRGQYEDRQLFDRHFEDKQSITNIINQVK
jgi:hypothetical protein